MGGIICIARNDLRLVLQDRAALLWLFLLPVVFATFFGLVMGGGGSPADAMARLTVVDQDGDFLSRALVAELDGERIEVVEIELEERTTTADKVRTLVIPAGFSTAVAAGERSVLRLERDPDTSMEASMVAEARILAAVSRLLGQIIQARVESDDQAPVSPEDLNNLEPIEDLVQVETRFAGQARITPDGFSQSIPGNVVMFVLLVALTYGAGSISAERSGGQLRRLLTTPRSRAEIVLGKIAGRFTVAALQIIVLLVFGIAAGRYIALPIAGSTLPLLAVLLAFAAAVAPLGVLVGAWVRDPDRAANTGVLITLVMAAFGGCWWPLEIVSPALRRLALFLPTGWAMNALHGVISYGHGLAGVMTPIVVLLAFAAVLTTLASRALRVE